jgi:uncharacterized membrane protein HdeD (DUF308 family)
MLQAALSGSALLAVLGALLIATGAASMTAGFGGWQAPPKVALGLGLLSGLFGGLAGNQGGLRAAGLRVRSAAARVSRGVAAVGVWLLSRALLMKGSRPPSSFVTVRPFPLDIPDMDCQA